MFRIQDPVNDELVREFMATFHYETGEARSNIGATTLYFRLGVSLVIVLLQSLVGDWGCIANMRPCKENFWVG